MKELRQYRRRAQATRRKQARVEETLIQRRNLLNHRRNELARALRQGQAGKEAARKLQREIRALEDRLGKNLQAARALRAAPAGLLGEPALQSQPWELVEGLSDRLPFLLLPVRIETRFMAVGERKELWVRIFPDDIAVHTHEPDLTADEANAGIAYWREIWLSRQETEQEKRQAIEKGAWRALAEAYGGTRAGWIARLTQPASLEVADVNDLQFPAFPEESMKADSWSQAPRSKVMPDCFVVMGFFSGKEVFRVAGNPIPDPLIVGPDPQAAETEFRQEGGELLAGEDIAWIYDFQAAVKLGMGVQIALEPPFDSQGLDQLLVLGLRLSADEKESQALLEELFENHSYAPDGLSLVPQGTPTNNTDRQGSGFSSADPGAEGSFALQSSGPLFEPVDIPLEKRDGQWLVEALGIRPEFFQRIQHAGGCDIRDAFRMNKALWNGTLGYFLEEMLDLSLERIGQVRAFFSDYVTGRGLLPAIRVGSQPYGILVTSDFSRWQWSQEIDAAQFSSLVDLYDATRRLEKTMAALISGVARIGAPDDPFQNLINTLGLQASSVEFYRRHAVGREYLWNYETFTDENFQGQMILDLLAQRASSLADELEANQLGFDSTSLPSIFKLSFFLRQDLIQDPVVDDIPQDEVEKYFETRGLRSIYQAPNPAVPEAAIETNYIGWLAFSPYGALKDEHFLNMAGETQPVPHPLLYRMLRASLLQAIHDAALRLYTGTNTVPLGARREVELGNIQMDRTVTRWEFMDANIHEVMPEVSEQSDSVAEFLLSNEGLSRPEAAGLRDTLESLRALVDRSTGQLERTFAEHIDLCSYRLDAWQTGCFNRRLLQQRYPPESAGTFEKRVQGIYLGAFGWLEDLRPAPELAPADLADIPASLHDPQRDGPLFDQPGNAGFIHAPSLQHAVTAAVLRSAYLTHFDPAHPEKMAVNLSSERVRTALAYLEGVRNGQELGALLGYQFERGLHDRYPALALDQYIKFFRQKFPLVADKITGSEDGTQIETKEARNVFDGYALVEAAFIQDSPVHYPYDITELPGENTDEGKAIQAEVARMADTLDAIADLSLAEGVYQVAQGNYERAGAMLKAMTEGNSPAEPEIVQTPRSGAALTQRVALHLPTGDVPTRWAGSLTQRALLEPGLNQWLGDLLPRPVKIKFFIRLGENPPVEQSLYGLGLQPIDLVYMIGDDLVGETTELESRIVFRNRRNHNNDALEVQIDFMTRPSDSQSVTLFELLPLLRALRGLITSSRPLGANDYELPSEATSQPDVNPNPQGVNLDELKARVQSALTGFAAAVSTLGGDIPPAGADGQPDPGQADPVSLRVALRALAEFGVPDAVPRSAAGISPQAKATLTLQAVNTYAVASQRLASAQASKTAGDDKTATVQERAARYRAVAQAIFGPAFNLMPSFRLKNQTELQAAAAFRDAAPGISLTRHHQDNPLIVDEWLHGAARVQPNLAALETVYILGENFGSPRTKQKPIQLPFRKEDFWVAVEYPQAFLPQGDFLSVLQVLPSSGFDPARSQRGLLIDEWIEVIPSKSEVTGIAFHFNQPNTEPPQALLLAITPEITGKWTWDKLVGILQNTLYRAHLRAVEPEQLGDTAFGQLLPAIITPVTSRRFATITTDLVHQTAVQFSKSTEE